MPDPSPFSATGPACGVTRPADTQGEGTSLLQSAQDAAGAVADRARDAASAVADRAQQMASSVADTTGQVASRVRDTAADAWDTTSEYAGDQFENLTRWVQRNPRTALCLGFAIGCCPSLALAHRYCLVTMRER